MRLLCLYTLALIMVGCGRAASPNKSSLSDALEEAIFQPSVTYDQAIAAISDMGLRVTLPCRESIIVSSDQTYPITWVRWHSVDQSFNYPRGGHSIWVTATPLAPSDWQDRLRKLPVVSGVPSGGTGSCAQNIADVTPVPGTLYFLTQDQIATYARVTIGGGGVPYDTAVANLNDIGLRLANVCYELRQSQGQHPAWRGMSQEQEYQASHSLVVAPTTDASNHWRDQVKALTGVSTIQAVTSAGC